MVDQWVKVGFDEIRRLMGLSPAQQAVWNACRILLRNRRGWLLTARDVANLLNKYADLSLHLDTVRAAFRKLESLKLIRREKRPGNRTAFFLSEHDEEEVQDEVVVPSAAQEEPRPVRAEPKPVKKAAPRPPSGEVAEVQSAWCRVHRAQEKREPTQADAQRALAKLRNRGLTVAQAKEHLLSFAENDAAVSSLRGTDSPLLVAASREPGDLASYRKPSRRENPVTPTPHTLVSAAQCLADKMRLDSLFGQMRSA